MDGYFDVPSVWDVRIPSRVDLPECWRVLQGRATRPSRAFRGPARCSPLGSGKSEFSGRAARSCRTQLGNSHAWSLRRRERRKKPEPEV
ncbi:hypothetical protein BD626DRAFT_40928 [Schizophyllum amplum]|uniref:Uncharacterized protein n=1 Tax=Schizophyllum amplum TaxID=97359 RepID=A0A550CD99_9AGAR|nr:hypothetical protein BD626DRAFT_40928 [Auriculariopsis ampla]